MPMKTLRYLSMIASMVGLVGVAHADTLATYNQKMDQMLSPVVQINRNCSATIIKSERDPKTQEVETLLLTAKHCVNDAGNKTQEVFIPVYQDNLVVKEDLYKAKVFKIFVDHDLALLKLLDDSEVFKNVARIAKEDVKLYEGEPTWTVGWSHAEIRTITDGAFNSRTVMLFPNPNVETEYFRATPQIAPGNSGGALFHKNLEHGYYELIGVTSAVIPTSDFMGYYVPIDAIDTFLNMVDTSNVILDLLTN